VQPPATYVLLLLPQGLQPCLPLLLLAGVLAVCLWALAAAPQTCCWVQPPACPAPQSTAAPHQQPCCQQRASTPSCAEVPLAAAAGAVLAPVAALAAVAVATAAAASAVLVAAADALVGPAVAVSPAGGAAAAACLGVVAAARACSAPAGHPLALAVQPRPGALHCDLLLLQLLLLAACVQSHHQQHLPCCLWQPPLHHWLWECSCCLPALLQLQAEPLHLNHGLWGCCHKTAA